MRFWLVILSALSLTACSWSNFPLLYKPDIQQGNELEQSHIAQLKTGMSRDEVVYLLGNPVLVNMLNPAETQYVYTFKPGKGTMTEQKILLTFDHDKLVTIEK